jgi:DNA-binding NarL/FixJ family response regulator
MKKHNLNKSRRVLNEDSQQLQKPNWLLEPAGNDRPEKIAGTNRAPGRQPEAAFGEITIVGFIDKYSFTRECITTSLQFEGDSLSVVSYTSCADVLKSTINHDVFIFVWHDENIEFERSELASEDFKTMASLGPVIVLGAIKRYSTISSAFEKGICGYIPLQSASLKLMIDGIRFAKAKLKFGIPFRDAQPCRDAQIDSESTEVGENQELTPREKLVLEHLKQGKSNKIIAHELKLSESTIKGYIYSIMRKMKVSNRTKVVCQIYAKGC